MRESPSSWLHAVIAGYFISGLNVILAKHSFLVIESRNAFCTGSATFLLGELACFAAKGRTGGDSVEDGLYHLGKDFSADVRVLWLLRLRENHATSLQVTMVPSTVPEHKFFLSVGEIPVVLGEDAAFHKRRKGLGC